jgi:UDP-N-acetylglucosamine transferase subunit ALG13
MGTIISALDHGKKLLLLPRLADMGEHRNDHQLATAKKFAHFSNIEIAKDVNELPAKMSELITQGIDDTAVVKTTVSEGLISAIKNFVNEN